MIGVFDSGVGGLTVAKELFESLPDHPLIYFGDTARLPYGTKPADLIKKWSLDNSRWLVEQGADLVVIACHTSSAWAFDLVSQNLHKPVFNMVEPGITEALRVTRHGRIGLIGTPGTVQSGVYERRVKEADPLVQIHLQACPLFVPLIEEGWMNRPGTREIAQEYLTPLKKHNIDTLIMGCTHYPLMREMIQEIMGEVTIVDPAKALAGQVRSFLDKDPITEKPNENPPKHQFFFSSEPYHLDLISQMWLGRKIDWQIAKTDGSP